MHLIVTYGVLFLSLIKHSLPLTLEIGPATLNSDFSDEEDIAFKSRRVLEHSITSKCVTLHNQDHKLGLDSCNWDKGRAESIGVFSLIKANPGGHLLRWSTAPKPNGTEGCLTLALNSDQEEEAKLRQENITIIRDTSGADDDIYLGVCDPKSPFQNWIFLPANNEKKGDYLVTKYGQDKCLAVPSPDSEVEEHLYSANCNKEDPEQIWRVCENLLNFHKCDA